MNEMILSKKIKEIIAPNYGFKLIEEENGIIIEIIPAQASVEGGVCSPVFDMWNNLVKCRTVSCGPGCRICTIHYPDGYDEYYCNCGPCPKPELENLQDNTEIYLAKPITEIVAPGCGFKLTEEDDSLLIEILPPKEAAAGGICAAVIDIGGNLIKCRAIDCGAGCRMCTYEYEDGYFEYYCKCGPCPKDEV